MSKQRETLMDIYEASNSDPPTEAKKQFLETMQKLMDVSYEDGYEDGLQAAAKQHEPA